MSPNAFVSEHYQLPTERECLYENVPLHHDEEKSIPFLRLDFHPTMSTSLSSTAESHSMMSQYAMNGNASFYFIQVRFFHTSCNTNHLFSFRCFTLHSFILLRRLRDMLVENRDVISFSPGGTCDGVRNLGRIIVHDRIKVEDKVLPKYFNHSSFASLRRQLNYFNFVRVGKGRQRESMYMNDDVVTLEDILHLKRRSVSQSSSDHATLPMLKCRLSSNSQTSLNCDTKVKQTVLLQRNNSDTELMKCTKTEKRKRSRHSDVNPYTTPFIHEHLQNIGKRDENNVVSEDEYSESKKRKPIAEVRITPNTDDEVLAGCNALLELASHSWNYL